MGRVRTRVYALVAMSRPAQLGLIAVVYALGGTVALSHGAAFDAERFAGGLSAIALLAASVHYANEYADYWTDARTTRTPFSGGSGALHRTGLPRRFALQAAGASLVLGIVFSWWCFAQGHLAVAAGTTLGSITVFGWQYSLPPFAFAWRGVGELANAALGGLALPAYGYAVLAGAVTVEAVLVTLPFACVVFCNLLETQWPDREADAAVGKDTLPTRWSPRRLRAAYATGALAGAGSLLALTLAGAVPLPVALGSLPAAPLLAWGVVRYTRREVPFPAVAAMVVLCLGQLAGWAIAAGLI